MAKVSYFIDGFNMYHALEGGGGNHPYSRYKWLDYYKLARLLTPGIHSIESVYYFTALQDWKPDSMKRHKTYIQALKTTPVSVVFGKYKDKSRLCKLCGGIYHKYHEEKQTDVNIGLHIIAGAFLDEFDRAILVTADTDLLPVIDMVKRVTPDKEVGMLFPIGRDRHSNDLRNAADFTMKMKEKHLRTCQFPDDIKVGTATISKPAEWC